MTFPDQSHINRVRDALHQRSGNGASVMVGSGFSKNAERVIRNAKEMPAWRDLVDHFYDTLYPPGTATRDGTNHRPATDNVRIAQEYEAVFGRSALHDALRRLVPDTEHIPGPEHHRLLKLPWRDIYTTNWDTLLERAQSQVSEQHYSTATSVEEIPMASRPRIVKLHGSLPAQFPLIVTEEDYRTYPTKFAPFVNTVQQSMMETVFLLIGFSGDDPNFLNWSGWVRDNLGASAPKIYLAGWLGLSPHRRRMLENHNVVPIDLAQHPRGRGWPDNLRNDRATEWLLRTLELGSPYNITRWPTPSNHRQDEIRDFLEPIETANPKEPKAERTTQDAEPESSREGVTEIIKTWRYNRLMYPGWLTVPFTNRWEMEWSTNAWDRPIMTSLPDLQPLERLIALRELVWRNDILLIPMHAALQARIQDTLDSVDCDHRTIGGTTAPTENWTAIREDWRNLALSLITQARFRFNGEAFEQAVKALEPFQDDDPDLCHRIQHEKCLWAIYGMDFDSLDILLTDWKTENCDPAWMMRKSALLWEIRRDSEAAELLDNAITAIKAMPPDDSSLASLSRESWATFVALDWDNRLTLLDRLKELVPMRCDALGERQSVSDSMRRNKAENDPPPFDINILRGASDRWINYDPHAAAYRAVRLSEMAGLPPFTGNETVWAEVLKKAAEEVADYSLEFAVRLVLRACSGDKDKTLGRVLTRAKIATIPTELAGTLAQICLNATDNITRDSVSRDSATHQRFYTAVEVLSRLAIRLEPDQAESILNKAVGYCQNAELARAVVGGTIRNLLMRSWEALPDERRQRRTMDLLSSDIIGLNNIEPILEQNWPDPGELVRYTETKLLRTPENEQQWQSTIDLIVRGLVANATARRRASYRMLSLVDSDLLTEDESQKIASALWDEHYTAPDGLPENTDLYDWEFLTLPELTPGLAQEKFRMKWLSHDENEQYEIQRNVRGFQTSRNSFNGLNHDPQDVEGRLWQVGAAIHYFHRQGKKLTLTETDKSHLAKLLEIWADDPVPEQDSFWRSAIEENSTKQLTQNVTEALPPIIGEITVSQCLSDKIYEKMRQLTTNKLPAFALAAGLVRIAPERTPDVATLLRVGITSDDYRLATNAVSGIYQWLEAASDPVSKVPQPPDYLIHEIGIAIASRRNTVVTTALDLAAWIFTNGQESQKEVIQQLIEEGLRYLAQELRYDREHENPDEVPRQRLYCAKLAVAMAKCGLDKNPAVVPWLETAKDDPLPEVRNTVAKQQDVVA